VKIDDSATNEFVVTSLNGLWWRNRGVWIGLHDTRSELHWQWTGATRREYHRLIFSHPFRPRIVSHTECGNQTVGAADQGLWRIEYLNTGRAKSAICKQIGGGF